VFWRRRKRYDPTALIALARAAGAEPWVLDALSRCTTAVSVSSAVVHFVNPENPNQSGSEWQFRENVVLDTDQGDVVLDIMKDGRVGAVEFVARLLG
jgi:hypothetical protein